MTGRSERERLRKAIFARCQAVRRRLESKGIAVNYRSGSLSGLRDGDGFTVRYSPGEGGVLHGHVTIHQGGEPTEEFHAERFEAGLARIEQRFAPVVQPA